jgi:hypothetical protein
VKCSGDLSSENQTHVLTTSFHAAHVGTIYAGLVRECLLRKTKSQALLSDCSAERHQLWCLGVTRGRARHSFIVES